MKVTLTSLAATAILASAVRVQAANFMLDPRDTNGIAFVSQNEHVLRSLGHSVYVPIMQRRTESGVIEARSACYGPCPGRGEPYQSHGCEAADQCRG